MNQDTQQPPPEDEPSPLKKLLADSWRGIQFWAVVAMVKACADIAKLAFKDQERKR